MQVYSDLAVLTARPTADDEARAPHRLYGHVDGARAYSAGAWARDVGGVLGEGVKHGEWPIIVGGTGLYFLALGGGLAEVPDIPEEVRQKWRRALAEHGSAALHAELARRFPEAAARLEPGDSQRILRSLEVLDATGRPLHEWHAAAAPALLDARSSTRLLVLAERDVLHARIGERLARMARSGAVEEAGRLIARRLDPGLPVMKAIGVAEFGSVAAGRLPLDAALETAAAATRRYAKRQRTWFRKHMADWTPVQPGTADTSALAGVLSV